VPPGQWVDRGTARAPSRPAAPPDAPLAPDWQI
jgi:hypothetical protein